MDEPKAIQYIREAQNAIQKAQLETKDKSLRSSLSFYYVQLEHLISLYYWRVRNDEK